MTSIISPYNDKLTGIIEETNSLKIEVTIEIRITKPHYIQFLRLLQPDLQQFLRQCVSPPQKEWYQFLLKYPKRFKYFQSPTEDVKNGNEESTPSRSANGMSMGVKLCLTLENNNQFASKKLQNGKLSAARSVFNSFLSGDLVDLKIN